MITAGDKVEYYATTQAKYDALETKEQGSFYFCTDTSSLYIGDSCIVSPSKTKDELFPIGKIEVFFDNEDHSNYLGFTWERCLQGRSPIGIDSSDNDFKTIGSQLGEKKHKLTVEEMPSHRHGYRYGGTGTGSSVAVGWHAFTIDNENQVDDAIKLAGGDQEHNNIQPSEVVAFWRRIS